MPQLRRAHEAVSDVLPAAYAVAYVATHRHHKNVQGLPPV